jgi:hypothetical protein
MRNHLGRLADDLQMRAIAEFDLIELADRYCSTSSIASRNLQALFSLKVSQLETFDVRLQQFSLDGQ